MKIKDLTKKDRKYIEKTHSDKSLTWDERMSILMQYFNKSERTIRNWIAKLNIKQRENPELSEHFEMAKLKEHDISKKRFIITYAQNNTQVHPMFFKNLISYSNFINAELLVVAGRYSNGLETLKKDTKESWANEVLPYLTAKKTELCKNLIVLANIKIQATAVNPLNSLESLTTESSCIIGHPRVHMKVLPVLDSDEKMPRMMFSTGTCTIPNFTDSKIGAIGEFHSTLGFCIVELKNDEIFFIRQTTATKNGNFVDLIHEVGNGIVKPAEDALCLCKGDIHYTNHDEKVLNKTFNDLVPKVRPKEIVLHDVLDLQSINHHETGDFIKQYRKEVEGKNSLKLEIDALLKWLKTIKHLNLVIVPSNHDLFLEKFIINGDIKKNIKNALEYAEYAKILLEGKAEDGLLQYIINKEHPEIKCLKRNQSYKIKGFEMAIHGSEGINGAKGGSPITYKKLNSKSISGHTHSPSRFDGALQIGCASRLRMGYNNGMSNWAWADVLITSNGKAQHIIYVGKNREYTTF